MQWNVHSEIIDGQKHAILGASKYAWLNYDENKLVDSYYKMAAVKRGTELHQLAHDLIRMGVKLPKTKSSFNMFVNDAIGYRMSSEQPLVYSYNAFGTADAICFRKNMLRIHDLKTGAIPGSMHQLEIYAAFFCLEYGKNPFNIEIELRIYQNDEVLINEPDPKTIRSIMDKIVNFDKRLDKLKFEEGIM